LRSEEGIDECNDLKGHEMDVPVVSHYLLVSAHLHPLFIVGYPFLNINSVHIENAERNMDIAALLLIWGELM
jgi:hypothetical protein